MVLEFLLSFWVFYGVFDIYKIYKSIFYIISNSMKKERPCWSFHPWTWHLISIKFIDKVPIKTSYKLSESCIYDDLGHLFTIIDNWRDCIANTTSNHSFTDSIIQIWKEWVCPLLSKWFLIEIIDIAIFVDIRFSLLFKIVISY